MPKAPYLVVKPYALSKTVLVNTVATLIGVLMLFAGVLEVWPGSGPVLDAAGLIVFVGGVLNIILRIWFTNTVLTAPFAARTHNKIAGGILSTYKFEVINPYTEEPEGKG